MNKTTTKRNKSSKKTVTRKLGNNLPKGINLNKSGTYRVRKMVNGVKLDVSLATLKDAKAILDSVS